MGENDESEKTEEFESEMQIPNNTGSTNETSSNEEEHLEDTEEGGEEDFGSSDFVPSSRFNSRATTSTFLEQSNEPVENLERDLGGVPNRNGDNNQAQTFNAPQYSSSKSYYEQPTDNTYPEQIRGARVRSGIEVSLPFDDLPKTRLLNPNETMGWRNQEDAGYPEQKYKFGSEPSKKRRNDL